MRAGEGEEDDVKTYVRRITAMRLNTAKDCKLVAEMSGGHLLKHGNKIQGVGLPNPPGTTVNRHMGVDTVLLGEFACHDAISGWSKMETMDGWVVV